MASTWLDDERITDARITDAPRSGQTVTGYGPKIPTRYMLRYEGRWHRVYMMQYGNSGTPYIRKGGDDLVFPTATDHRVEELARSHDEGGRTTDPSERNQP
ncbi:hypothetical protein SEA_BRUHMOMENT_108 [Arthrobacter phage BruhMoment]|nr:hypothetical protein SEA_BRUHMOMENT_108 [Arthrobacter phage BruhMoment]